MSTSRCPVCGKSFEPDDRSPMPFCSRRCRQVDLGRWLDERYGLPAEPEEPSDASDDPPPEP